MSSEMSVLGVAVRWGCVFVTYAIVRILRLPEVAGIIGLKDGWVTVMMLLVLLSFPIQGSWMSRISAVPDAVSRIEVVVLVDLVQL